MYGSPLSLLSGVYVTRYRDASEEMKQVGMSEMELEAAFYFKVRFKIHRTLFFSFFFLNAQLIHPPPSSRLPSRMLPTSTPSAVKRRKLAPAATLAGAEY